MNDREKLLKRVMICDFVLNDAALYLDTHPKDQKALDYYKKYMAMKDEAKREFVEKYGPLERADYNGGDSWNWVNGPWPWQNQEGK